MKPHKSEYRAVGAFCILLAALCIAGIAQAATVTVTWVNPTTNTDDSAIPASGPGALTNARIEYGTCNGAAFGVKAGEVTRPQPATSTTLNLQPGTTCVRVFVSNTYGSESSSSNVGTKVVDAPIPRPPQLTTIAAQVYDVTPNERTFRFDRGRQVGTIKLGAACDEDRNTDADWYALERPSRVALTRSARSTALVAKCGAAVSGSGGTASSPGDTGEILDDGGRVLVGSGHYTAAR